MSIEAIKKITNLYQNSARVPLKTAIEESRDMNADRKQILVNYVQATVFNTTNNKNKAQDVANTFQTIISNILKTEIGQRVSSIGKYFEKQVRVSTEGNEFMKSVDPIEAFNTAINNFIDNGADDSKVEVDNVFNDLFIGGLFQILIPPVNNSESQEIIRSQIKQEKLEEQQAQKNDAFSSETDNTFEDTVNRLRVSRNNAEKAIQVNSGRDTVVNVNLGNIAEKGLSEILNRLGVREKAITSSMDITNFNPIGGLDESLLNKSNRDDLSFLTLRELTDNKGVTIQINKNNENQIQVIIPKELTGATLEQAIVGELYDLLNYSQDPRNLINLNFNKLPVLEDGSRVVTLSSDEENIKSGLLIEKLESLANQSDGIITFKNVTPVGFIKLSPVVEIRNKIDNSLELAEILSNIQEKDIESFEDINTQIKSLSIKISGDSEEEVKASAQEIENKFNKLGFKSNIREFLQASEDNQTNYVITIENSTGKTLSEFFGEDIKSEDLLKTKLLEKAGNEKTDNVTKLVAVLGSLLPNENANGQS